MAKNTADFEKLKAPNQPVVFTSPAQLQEFFNCAKDPVYFMEKFMFIQHATQGKIRFNAYEFQKELINTYKDYRNTLAMIPRQSGKCVVNITTITVKQNSTGKVYEIPIGEYHTWAVEMQDSNTSTIDISKYEKNKETYNKVWEPEYTDPKEIIEKCISFSNTIERKFTSIVELDDWSVLTDTGWHPCTHINQTIEYEVWYLILENGMHFGCADTHIVFDSNLNEIFVKDLVVGDLIQTNIGFVKVVDIINTGQTEHMYDLSVESINHRYYTNGILSHNTTTAAGFLLWYATFNSDVTVLIAANKFRAANEIMMKIKYAYEELPNHIRAGVTEYNVQSIKFDNGSRIVSTTTTPDSGRGMAISLLYLDEFAYVKPRIATEFWTAMAPTLATGGRCIITSTPASDEDMFAELWFGASTTINDNGDEIPDGIGKNGFRAFSAHYSQVPGRDEEWADNERAKIGLDRFRREYECEFAGEESTLISSLALQRLNSIEPIKKTGEVRWYDKITPNRTYLVSLDPSAGVGKDSACIQAWSLPDMVQVAEWSSNRVSIPHQVRTMQTIMSDIYNDLKNQGAKGEPEIYYTLENNTWGEAALQTVADIGEENFMGQFLHEPRKYGTVRRRKGLNGK